MGMLTDSDMDILQRISNVDLSARDQLNLIGQTDLDGQVEDATNETDILLIAWVSLKKELYLALCTNDPKYEKLRKAAEALESDMTTVVAALLATVTIGIPAAILTSIGKILLMTVARLGINVFCKVNEADKVLGRLTRREQEIVEILYGENVNNISPA